MGIYMDFDGIKGEATDQDHRKWIDVLSLSWGAGRANGAVLGSAQNSADSQPRLSDMTVVKLYDASTPQLWTEASTGNQGKTVRIDLTTTGSPSKIFCTYSLENALISSYSVQTLGDRPTENISISFTKLEFKFTPYDDKNKAGTPTTVSYDIETTKSSLLAQPSSNIDVTYDGTNALVAASTEPVLEQAGPDLLYTYYKTNGTATFQSGSINLTSRLGSLDNDVLVGTDNPEILNGLGGDDILRSGGGNDVINGGSGLDTAVFRGTLAQHHITLGGAKKTLLLPTGTYDDQALNIINTSQFNVGSGNLLTVADQVSGRDGTDTLSQVERLKFIDAIVAFDSGKGQNAGEAYRLYQGAFNRAPDQNGLGYWIKFLDQGASLAEIARTFIVSPEYAQKNGTLSESEFVTLLYKNALNRTPDADGLAYWVNALSVGISRSEALVSFSESVECVEIATVLVANGIQYKEWIS